MTHINCDPHFADPFRCYTKEEYLVQLMGLLPHGRAWQSHDASTSANITRYDYSAEVGEAQAGDAVLGQIGLQVERTFLARYWASFAEVNEFFAQKACELLDEFFCETIHNTLDWWADDYGFPDPCDPWDELCEKVGAFPESTCAWLQWAAATRGWYIECTDCTHKRSTAMAGCAFAGCAYPCWDCEPSTIHITIDIAQSPAAVRPLHLPLAGIAKAGCAINCFTPHYKHVECLIERVKPAHVQAIYHFGALRNLGGLSFAVGSPEAGTPSIDAALGVSVGAPEATNPSLTAQD